MKIFLLLSLVALAYAGLISLAVSNMYINDNIHLIISLGYNIDAGSDTVRQLSTLIVHVIIGLSLYLIGYLNRGKDGSGNICFLAYFIVGLFFTFWGTFFTRTTLEDYDVHRVLSYPNINSDWISESLPTIVSRLRLLGVVWICTGIIIAATSAYQFLIGSPPNELNDKMVPIDNNH